MRRAKQSHSERNEWKFFVLYYQAIILACGSNFFEKYTGTTKQYTGF